MSLQAAMLMLLLTSIFVVCFIETSSKPAQKSIELTLWSDSFIGHRLLFAPFLFLRCWRGFFFCRDIYARHSFE